MALQQHVANAMTTVWKKHIDVHSSGLIAIDYWVQIRTCNDIKSLSHCVIASLSTYPYITNISKKLSSRRKRWKSCRLQDKTCLQERRLLTCIDTFWTFGFTFSHFFSFHTEVLLPSNLQTNQFLFSGRNKRLFVISIIQVNTHTKLWWGNQM